MADVGDRIAVTSKGQPRSGVVTAVSGAMITVRWDTGGETSLSPGPGVLSVVRKAAPDKTAAASKKPAAEKPVAEKVATGKKPMAKATSSSRTPGKKTQ